jgi:hypothetical protein
MQIRIRLITLMWIRMWTRSLIFVGILKATDEREVSRSGTKSGSESGAVGQWFGSAIPDPYRNVTDPLIWDPRSVRVFSIDTEPLL